MSEHLDARASELAAALTHRRLSRRQLLRYAGASIGAFGIAQALAACSDDGGGGGGGGGVSPSEVGSEAWWSAQEIGPELVIANWSLYIDRVKEPNGDVVYPSLELFTKESGIEVDYREVIDTLDTFFAKIQPQLQAGQPLGYDVIPGFTNGKYFDAMLRLGYVIPIDQSKVPNFFEHAAEVYKDPTYDPGNEHSIAFMSGITGIAYDPSLTGREITSFQDLLDPAFEGKVGMFGDTLDMPNFALVGMGVDPTTSTPDDWQAAADMIIEARDSGLVRQFYGANYINALSRGDVALTMGWSGDVFQQNKSGDSEGLQFVVPEEGAVIWTDNIVIPQGSANPAGAMEWMNFVYQPEIMAMMAEWITYIPPVPAARDVVLQDAQKASGKDAEFLRNFADSPLVFPSEEDMAKLFRYRVLTPEEEQQWNSIFQQVYQG
jgi:spermidine/putrescine transport system substrate-binding protein